MNVKTRYRVDRRKARMDFQTEWLFEHYRETPPSADEYPTTSRYRFREEQRGGLFVDQGVVVSPNADGEWIEFDGQGSGRSAA